MGLTLLKRFTHSSRKQAVSQQIIIIENTNHKAGIPLDDNINIVEFSKDKRSGRYGYLDGVYDVSDES